MEAIERARELETDIYALLNTVGTNMPLLFDIINGDLDSMWDCAGVRESASTKCP